MFVQAQEITAVIVTAASLEMATFVWDLLQRYTVYFV